jgi:hypothetical protein
LRPSHVCFICGTLPTGTLIVCISNFFPPKENHNEGRLRFDDDHDHICYRFAQVQIFGGKSNVFKSLHRLDYERFVFFLSFLLHRTFTSGYLCTIALILFIHVGFLEYLSFKQFKLIVKIESEVTIP